MVDEKISELPPSGAANLTDEIASNEGGTTRRQTHTQVKTLYLLVLDEHTFKTSVRVATTVNITRSGEQTIDGITTSTDRILVKDQAIGAENGIYDTAVGAWTRTTDFNTSAKATSGAAVFVQEGTANADKLFQLTTNEPITLDTTALVFTGFLVAELALKSPLASPTFTGTVTTGIINTGALTTGAVNVQGNNIDNIQNLIHDLSTATSALDFANDELQEISITANLTLTATGYAIGRTKVLKITTDGSLRTLTFPAAWVFITAKPIDQAASKIGILSLTCFTGAEAGVIASYAVET